MKLEELSAVLEAQGIHPSAYSIGSEGDESYVIRQEGSAWQVYYAERGQKTSLRSFATEADACDLFMKWIDEDRTTRRPGR